jgi:putative flavoprotein involved in K+ transport
MHSQQERAAQSGVSNRVTGARSHYSVIVVGGGQAGLSVSYGLKQRGIDHLVFEQHVACHAWREKRWDSFCLVTPNWQCQLPGFSYAGDDPDGFMKKQEIVAYLDSFIRQLEPPLREGVRVTRVCASKLGGYSVSTSIGEFSAEQVVIAAGNYHVPKIPAMAARLPAHLVQMHASEYRNAATLAPGAVLVVGTGQSGCQIAEDLHLEGRQVHLCVGGAPRVARRYRGRDVVAWLHDMGHYDLPVDRHPLKEGVRAKANHYVTGRDGGRDIDLRLFARQGMQLHGRLLDIDRGSLHLGADLARNLDNADATSESIKRSIDVYITQQGIDAPTEAAYVPPWSPGEPRAILDLAEAGVSTVIWSMGYRAEFGWIEFPVFDANQYPVHQRGVTAQPGLYFIGLPWLYTWGSGRFSGIARDAAFLVEKLAARQPRAEAASGVAP